MSSTTTYPTSEATIEISRCHSGWQLTARQFFPLPRQELFEFFATAESLEQITPPWLRFEIITPTPIAMHSGAIIDYKLRLHLIPIRWRTEISDWEPPGKFVDRQIKGPYKKWIHTHSFIEQNNGTLMVDSVEYDVPFGVILHKALVQQDLIDIFTYRQTVLKQQFGFERAQFG